MSSAPPIPAEKPPPANAYSNSYLIIDGIMIGVFTTRGIVGLCKREKGAWINFMLSAQFVIDATANVVSTKMDGGSVGGTAAVQKLLNLVRGKTNGGAGTNRLLTGAPETGPEHFGETSAGAAASSTSRTSAGTDVALLRPVEEEQGSASDEEDVASPSTSAFESASASAPPKKHRFLSRLRRSKAPQASTASSVPSAASPLTARGSAPAATHAPDSSVADTPTPSKRSRLHFFHRRSKQPSLPPQEVPSEVQMHAPSDSTSTSGRRHSSHRHGASRERSHNDHNSNEHARDYHEHHSGRHSRTHGRHQEPSHRAMPLRASFASELL